MKEVEAIKTWLSNGAPSPVKKTGKTEKNRGYRVVFDGGPDTDKIATAEMLGNQFRKEVYRVDLREIISKYIGETEKNLAKLFKQAEEKGWILFFDEADALFGKPTDVRDSHDRYANRKTRYILDRMETFEGLMILSTNLEGNMGKTYMCRFQSVVHFPKD